jgi:surface antigen
VFNFAWAIGKILETRMGEVDRGYHTRAVYHALNNAVEGQDVEWFNDSMGSQGRARIVWTHPSPGGWCRRVHSLVYFNRHSMTYEDTACYNTQTNSWNFIAK